MQRKGEAGTGGRDHRETLLNGLLLVLFSLSYITQDYPLRGGTTHSGLNLLTSNINQENALQANLVEAFSHLR